MYKFLKPTMGVFGDEEADGAVEWARIDAAGRHSLFGHRAVA